MRRAIKEYTGNLNLGFDLRRVIGEKRTGAVGRDIVPSEGGVIVKEAENSINTRVDDSSK